jgi:hypothetical protein
MLIDNKFIYLSLPRCASTAFFISCIRNNIKVEHSYNIDDNMYVNIDFESMSNMDLVYKINHFHETIESLKNKFGNDYEIVSVNRNRYDRFISYFNHITGELYRRGYIELYNKLLELNVNDILFYNSADLINVDSKIKLVKTFLNSIELFDYDKKIESLFLPLFSPLSTYHNHNPTIKWFEFDNLSELENWVAIKLNKPFKLENFGSSINYKSKLIMDDAFIKKYNDIYDYYDLPKSTKTII